MMYASTQETSNKDGTSNRFREEAEIKAHLWTCLNSRQIQAKSSNPPKVLTEHTVTRQHCLPVATICFKNQKPQRVCTIPTSWYPFTLRPKETPKDDFQSFGVDSN